MDTVVVNVGLGIVPSHLLSILADAKFPLHQERTNIHLQAAGSASRAQNGVQVPRDSAGYCLRRTLTLIRLTV